MTLERDNIAKIVEAIRDIHRIATARHGEDLLEALAVIRELSGSAIAKADAILAALSPSEGVVEEVERLRAALANPPKHRFWRAGETDCPRDVKAPNGELHTLRCKVCGLDDPRDEICRAGLGGQP